MNHAIRTAATALVLAAGAARAADEVAKVKALEAEEWTVPGIEMKMRLVPAGTFRMGSPKGEVGRRDDEVRHEVTLSRPFYMGVYEVAQGQFYRLMMPKDYAYEAWQYKRGPVADGAAFHYREDNRGRILTGNAALGGRLTLERPMECVSWYRARRFCEKLTEVERRAGRLPPGYVYRLPTEAEWEYACRAGTTGPYNVPGDYTSLAGIKRFAFLSYCNGWVSATGRLGGGRRPNAWGLYDMHGNVYEWCLDWYGPYPAGNVVDPTGPAEGTEKVVRGGCFVGGDDLERTVHPFLRSASRYSVPPDAGYYGIVGFRVVLGPDLEAGPAAGNAEKGTAEKGTAGAGGTDEPMRTLP